MADTHHPATSERGVVEVRGDASGLAQDIVAGNHRLRADEPASLGGSDTGPTPYDLLLAALGSCMSMTLRMYARRKQWPLHEVSVRLRHDRIHARDCEQCETREGRIDHIDVELHVGGPLDAAQRLRLLEIAGMCPVHRTLTRELHIVERLAGDDVA